VVGQATYLHSLNQQPALFDYDQFRPPADVPAISSERMEQIIPIYLRAGLTHEQLTIPDVAFSIRAIEADNSDLHAKMAQGLRLVGAAPGVSPGLALVVDQAERYGHTRLTQDILIATEHNMKQRQADPSTPVPAPKEISEYMVKPNAIKSPLGNYSP